MLKYILYQIYDHPGVSGFFGSATALLFGMINIPETTEILELAGVIIKDIGILAGSTVAVASLCGYAAKNWFKNNKKQNNEPS